MAEIFKATDLYLVAWLTLVQIIDYFRAWAKPDEVEIQFVTHRTDKTDQILVFLFCAILVTLPVYKPRNLRVRAKRLTQLVGAQPRGPHKVRPPMIVRESLVFFPLIHRRPAHKNDVFTRCRRRRLHADCEDAQKSNEQKTFHHGWRMDYLCWMQKCASNRANCSRFALRSEALTFQTRPRHAAHRRRLQQLNFIAHEIFPCLPSVNQREHVAANQRLGQQRPLIVFRSHHKPLRARAHNREQIALVQLRHFPVQRKEITRLAYGPDDVDFVNFPLGFTLTRSRIPALTLAHSFTLTWRFASASRARDRAEGCGEGTRFC